MSRLGLRPYRAGDSPPIGAIPVSVIVLTCNEELNIRQCLTSVAWAEQVVVLDSGSSDGTIAIARSFGAQVVEQPWLGFAAQRERALRLPELRHDWVYFVDADEWISPELAAEIATRLQDPSCAGFAQRFRLVFQGRWIRHCGWYRNSWLVRLVDRRVTRYDGGIVGERAQVGGSVGRLRNDLVDQDRKGLASWLRKHVGYAELEARRRDCYAPRLRRVRSLRARGNTRPLSRAILKDVIFPALPARPIALFIYMYLVRFGFLDGKAGLRFCFFHAWHEATISALRASDDMSLLTATTGMPVDNQASREVRMS
jgi:glycosyltransferase involved in cell wall biosynthesis